MNTVPPPARTDNSATPPPHPQRVAEAHRRLHESQVGLSFGDANSLATDEAADEYRDSVADAVAANDAKLQELVGALRLLAGDETGLRELAGRYLNEATGAVPARTLAVPADVIQAARDTRRDVAALGVEVLDAVSGVAALKANLKAVVKALATAGIEVTA